jgi:hypothetical protein
MHIQQTITRQQIQKREEKGKKVWLGSTEEDRD